MKRFAVSFLYIVLCLILCFSSATATGYSPLDHYELEPGIYKVGTDIPEGFYDVRFAGLDFICTIRYSDRLTDEGELDMSRFYSYSFTYMATEWWQAVYPIILISDYGYLEIEHSACKLWPEKTWN